MKKLKFLLLGVSIAGLALVSCEEDSSNDDLSTESNTISLDDSAERRGRQIRLSPSQFNGSFPCISHGTGHYYINSGGSSRWVGYGREMCFDRSNDSYVVRDSNGNIKRRR